MYNKIVIFKQQFVIFNTLTHASRINRPWEKFSHTPGHYAGGGGYVLFPAHGRRTLLTPGLSCNFSFRRCLQLWFNFRSTLSRCLFDAPSTRLSYQRSLSAQWRNPLAAVTLTYLFRPQCSRPRTQVDVRSRRRSSNGRRAVESKSNTSRIVRVTTALDERCHCYPIQLQTGCPKIRGTFGKFRILTKFSSNIEF